MPGGAFRAVGLPGRLLKVMPPPVWVFFAGTLVSTFILKLDKPHLINVPDSLKHGVVFPQFGDAFTHAALLLPLAYLVVTLLLIDGTESLATIAAADNIDTYRRRSDPDRTLLAMGVSNVASSLLGGLTIIPGMVKTTANVLGGGRTQWANFYNACFLLTFLLLGRDLINMVPMAVLAAILVFIGYKLCKPAVWLHVARVGTEQFVVFTTHRARDRDDGPAHRHRRWHRGGVGTEPVVRGPLAHPEERLGIRQAEFCRPLPQSLPQSGVATGIG